MTPTEQLERIHATAATAPDDRDVVDPANRERIEHICVSANRACVRLAMACMLAKLDRPAVDPRKPYTEIGTLDCFSGRAGYDEPYLTPFITLHRLPCNPTTAFLTPVLRNLDRPLTTDRPLIGRPRRLYAQTLQLLEDVAEGRESAAAVLTDIVRILLRIRDVRSARLQSLQAELSGAADAPPLSVEQIVTLLAQHLACRHTSRLPVLMVAAAYDAVADRLGESRKPLHSHNAADLQTGAAGDLEVTLIGDNRGLHGLRNEGPPGRTSGYRSCPRQGCGRRRPR